MAEISRYGKEWEKVVKRNRKLIYEVPEPIAYWVYQTLATFWECNFKKLSENDKKYIGQFINILKAKLKLRQVQM
jgi:hypothetical protein